jgi:hypothetical protein
MVAGAALVGLLLAGIPLMSLMGGNAGGEDDDIGTGDGDAPEDTALSGDALEDPGVPVDYEFVLRAGDETIAGFRPGIDTLTITADSWELTVSASEDPEDGALLEVERGGVTAVLRFPDLAAVPLNDIHLNVEVPGEPPVTVPIADATEPLVPTAPDAQEDAPPAPVSGPPVAPADPEAPDVPPAPADPSAPLLPADPDAPEA